MRIKPILLAVITAFVASCAMPTDDYLNNRYLEQTPVTPSDDMVGTWTGNRGPYLVTVVIEADGTGLHCYDWKEIKTVEKLIFNGEEIFYQSGVREKPIPESGRLILQSPYLGKSKDTYHSDSGLTKASVYCAEQLGRQKQRH